MSDLALGLRLAVGGGRSSVVRFALSTFGIGIAVAVLLVGASLGAMAEGNETRENADWVGESVPVAGVTPLYWQQSYTEFRGESVEVSYVYADGDNPPVPQGIDELPGPGEVVASPALADLLAAPEGELLLPRFPGEVVGVLGKAVVPEPGELKAYIGADAGLVETESALAVYEFGRQPPQRGMPPQLLVVVLIGSVVLLLPIFIFVSSSSRIAGAERDRRLSALRLVGSGSRQVRRIAAAESLVSALAGLVLGTALFLVMRQFAENVEFFGMGVYTSDVVPDPVLVTLIVLAIPGLAVLTALFALRRTIIEPLGVVRQSRPVRRRLWWRLAMVVLGVVLLFTQGGVSEGSDGWAIAMSAGAALLLIGVPVLLPWLVERVAGRIEGGPSSWQLAIRRLQLDSGTSARVVGGVAVVLAGAIALQTLLMTVEKDIALPEEGGAPPDPTIEVQAEHAIVDDVVADLTAVPAVRDLYPVRYASGYQPDATRDSGVYLSVADCRAVRDLAGIEDCTDGDVFTFTDMGPTLKPGDRIEFREYGPWTEQRVSEEHEVTGTWTVPDRVREMAPIESADLYTSAIVTPGALSGFRMDDERTMVMVKAGNPTSDELEQIRNAVAGFSWRTNIYSYGTEQDLTARHQTYLAVRNALYAGSIFTLLLAGVSLLVLALEHIRERRRPLAMLVASGVQRGVLARSLLWQVALPITLGVAMAVVTGVGLAWLAVRITDEVLLIDWLGVGLLSAAAVLLSVLVTAMTLPFLRSATRLTSLRTE